MDPKTVHPARTGWVLLLLYAHRHKEDRQEGLDRVHVCLLLMLLASACLIHGVTVSYDHGLLS